jgi:hypothetical protein
MTELIGKAFKVVSGEYGYYNVPIDNHALYGPEMWANDDIDDEVPVRNDARSLVEAIRTVSEGDRVRVNDRGWMEVVEPDESFFGEGFVCRYENGSVLYEVMTSNPTNRPKGTFDRCWMRRFPGHASEGPVDSLEVEWGEK